MPTLQAISEIVDRLPPFPRFPQAFGPRDRSNLRDGAHRLKNVDLEISRTIVRGKTRTYSEKVTK